MKNADGDLMGGKKVDFVLTLEPDADFMRRIKKTLLLQTRERQNLNQTTCEDVRNLPIFLNIETKIPNSGGEKADVQLSTWGYAGFTKMHQLLGANGHPTDAIPAVPMVSAHGHDWHLAALQERGEENLLMGRLALGTTETIQGIFQIMKALDVLATWGHTKYKPWYLDKVIAVV